MTTIRMLMRHTVIAAMRKSETEGDSENKGEIVWQISKRIIWCNAPTTRHIQAR
jgi:hypothetical protein